MFRTVSLWVFISVLCSTVLIACGSTPKSTSASSSISSSSTPSNHGGIVGGGGSTQNRTYSAAPEDWDFALPDRAIYNQKDKRWAKDTLGKTNDTMAAYGCLVTATSMALSNLGFQTNPKDFNARMSKVGGFNARGWMVWSGIEKVTDNKATFKFYDTVSDEIIEGCMADGFYPLARFILPNGRDHWSMIVGKSAKGFHMRDPLRISEQPLIFPRGSDAFKSVRCVGMKG